LLLPQSFETFSQALLHFRGLKHIHHFDPYDEATDVGPLIDEASAARAKTLVREASENGALVLTGGECNGRFFTPCVIDLATDEMMVVLLDACVRLLPGVMGAAESGAEESFEAGLLEYPHYTRPQVFERVAIPEVLGSGHHGKIAEWRRAEAERITRERRPELLVDGGKARDSG